MVEALKQVAEAEGWRVGVNTPFAGSYVPVAYFEKDPRVVSVMLELNRSRYLTEDTSEPGRGFASAQALVAKLAELGLQMLHGEGRGDLGDWPPEPSMLVLGISERTATELGRRYGQAVIVVGRRGEPARLLVL